MFERDKVVLLPRTRMVIRASRAVSLCRFTTTTGALSLSCRAAANRKKEGRGTNRLETINGDEEGKNV